MFASLVFSLLCLMMSKMWGCTEGTMAEVLI